MLLLPPNANIFSFQPPRMSNKHRQHGLHLNLQIDRVVNSLLIRRVCCRIFQCPKLLMLHLRMMITRAKVSQILVINYSTTAPKSPLLYIVMEIRYTKFSPNLMSLKFHRHHNLDSTYRLKHPA